MDKYPGPDLPIRGGWGYDQEDACIIDKNDPIIDPDSPMPFYGVGYEKIFVERRIYMELITYRKEDEHIQESNGTCSSKISLTSKTNHMMF